MKLLLAVMLLGVVATASAQVHDCGYTKKDGTYITPP